ncbi:VOC family protein [Massilia sp. 9I]|uniref:VOC family protein n=1 Tax=Massilia sp. 9I TaxID=2653152 RepID=UPI0012F33F6B|nr:VOC family protein [Massilia sp. 9I]VXB12594.1 Glyoxalase/bleomycin resistance protein/dioxygenase [Massilia sp. 9I]
MTNNVVGWFEIYVEDMNRARRFYEDVLGLELAKMLSPAEADGPLEEMCAFPAQQNAYGAPGALVRMEGFKPGGNSVLVYFICDDCAAAAARAAAAGGRIFKDKFSIGQYGYIALVNDIEGNMIGLHSMT